MTQKKEPPLNVFLLIMIIMGTVLSIKNWPFMAEYGLSSVIYLLLAAAIFFIPVSLVSAELASGWPEEGGIYVWIKEALGERFAFIGVWLLWVSNIVWYPTTMSFIVATLSYSFFPSLAENPGYTVVLMLALFWALLIGNFFGIRYSGWFGAATLVFGTLIPGAFIIAFGAIWAFSGAPSQIEFSWVSLIPHKASLGDLIFLVGILLSFAGMEMNAVHAKEVVNPKRNFPKAIFLSALAIVLISILGSLSIGMAIPAQNVDIVKGVMDTIAHYLKAYGLGWALPLFTLMIALGASGGLSTWLVGTSKGLLTASRSGHLPPLFRGVNRHGVPVPILLLQGFLVSLLTLVFMYMPNISSAFWILTALSAQAYLIVYILMFISGIILRSKKPDVARSYSIPGGKIGLYIAAGLGIATCIASFILCFIPPSQIETGSLLFYESFLTLGVITFTLTPLLLSKLSQRKPLAT